MAPKRPNIVVLMTDQQRYDSLGCYGFPAAHTPNLDQLAAEGALFEHDYVNNPICTPSRASMMTGKSLPGHGVYRLYDNLPADEVLATEHLQRMGYHTALFGKLHVSSKDFEASRRHPHDGFDVYEWCLEGGLCMDSPFQAYAAWLRHHHPAFHDRLHKDFRRVLHHPPECHLTHWVADRTVSFIEASDGARPFFCMASIFDPHNPYQDYPEEMRGLVDQDRIPPPLITEGEFDGKPAALLREHRSSYLGDFTRLSGRTLAAMRYGYHASIAFADQQFGRILDALQRKGIAEDTLVVFTSDHGDMLGDHQLLVKGAFFYDPNTRVPLLMRWPRRFSAGRRVDALVQNHDLAATILAAAGMSPAELSGLMPESRDLLPLAAGETDAVHEEVVCCYRNSGISSEPSRTPYFDPPIHATMIRDSRHKLNLWHDVQEPNGELYDMQQDPLEQHNLWSSPDHMATRARLTGRLCDWLATHERRQGSRGGETRPTRMLKNRLRP